MKRFLVIFVAFGLFVTVGCAATSAELASQCAVRQIDEVVRDPIGHTGELFCGEVLVLEYGRSARILSSADEIPPSNDLALLVTSNSRRLLEGLSTVPRDSTWKRELTL